jgi:hypothetical protein
MHRKNPAKSYEIRKRSSEEIQPERPEGLDKEHGEEVQRPKHKDKGGIQGK